jgi:hypothetical protein
VAFCFWCSYAGSCNLCTGHVCVFVSILIGIWVNSDQIALDSYAQ